MWVHLDWDSGKSNMFLLPESLPASYGNVLPHFPFQTHNLEGCCCVPTVKQWTPVRNRLNYLLPFLCILKLKTRVWVGPSLVEMKESEVHELLATWICTSRLRDRKESQWETDFHDQDPKSWSHVSPSHRQWHALRSFQQYLTLLWFKLVLCHL